MSNTKEKIGSWYLVVLSICALLTGMLYANDVRADAGPGMERGPHDGHCKMKGPHDGPGRGMHDFVGHALHSLLRDKKDLDLSEEQSSKIKSIATDYEKSRIRGEADVKLAELDVRTRMFDPKAEMSSIESALKKSESAHTVLRLDGVKAMRAATAVLTPEQREKWHQSRMHRMMHRDGAGMGEREHRDGQSAYPHDPPKGED